MLLENAKILVGDDSILARKQLKDVLTSFGAKNFIDAANGQEAIDQYKAEKPDLVFLDIVMPVKDGIAAVQEICEFDASADIVRIFCRNTASVKTGNRSRCKGLCSETFKCRTGGEYY